MRGIHLIMDLTGEQGLTRSSQVQPPIGVWEQFFGFSTQSPLRPTVRLVNMVDGGAPEQRKVVKHHHNFTIEIRGAKVARPAIVRMRRVDAKAFEYWVYRRGSKEYSHCDWLLKTFSEDVKGRRWVII